MVRDPILVDATGAAALCAELPEHEPAETPNDGPDASGEALLPHGVLWATSDASPAELARRQRVVDAIAKAAARKPSSRWGRR